MGKKGKNMTQQHIDDDTLSMFVKTASRSVQEKTDLGRSSNDEILDHLAHCQQCRNQASALATLHDEWTNIHQHSALTEDQHRLICDYIDGFLSADEADEVKIMIETQPDAMKAALHYQTHRETMKQDLSRKETAAETHQAKVHKQEPVAVYLMSLLGQFFSIRSPMVYTMTATAALFVAILLMVRVPELHSDQVMIATYQDNPTIQFTDNSKLPGVGFFSQSGNSSKPFKDITIELVSENTIRISWPEVAGAELYKMRIQVFNQGKKTVLQEKSTQSRNATFQLEHGNPETGEQSINKRYEWVLYGNTRDDRMFYASGGFVISLFDSSDSDYDTW
jgi:hypothetical protein